MAERYGGRYSPREDHSEAELPQKNAFTGKTRSKAGGRVNFLFLAPLPLAVTAFFQDPAGLAGRLVAVGLLLLAAWLTREGILAQEAYEARKIARRPAFPRKIAASLLTGLGLALPALVSGNLMSAVIFGVIPIRERAAA